MKFKLVCVEKRYASPIASTHVRLLGWEVQIFRGYRVFRKLEG